MTTDRDLAILVSQLSNRERLALAGVTRFLADGGAAAAGDDLDAACRRLFDQLCQDPGPAAGAPL